jgi:hypothetical protein
VRHGGLGCFGRVLRTLDACTPVLDISHYKYHPFARSVLSTDLRSCNACRPPQTLAQRVNYASLSSLPLHEARPLAVLSDVPGSPTSMHKRASIFTNVIRYLVASVGGGAPLGVRNVPTKCVVFSTLCVAGISPSPASPPGRF